MYSAWKMSHDFAEGACPECQGSCYIPAPKSRERIVNQCPQCEGTGKEAPKRAA